MKHAAILCVAAAALAACTNNDLAAPNRRPAAPNHDDISTLAQEVRTLAAGRGVGPLVRPAPVRPALVRLGQALAFDKILSGNRDISCMTCHLPAFATGDARSLPIGQGGIGLGPARMLGTGVLIPRNAPPLFNLFALEALFWDGRVSRDAQGNYHTPAGNDLTANMRRVFEFGPVSAQGLFPVMSRAEMRGSGGNELAALADDDFQGTWRGLMRRLGDIPEYRQMFEAAYPGTKFQQMSFAHATNAMAGFFIDRMSFTNTPWDQFLAGNDNALTPAQLDGAKTFLSLKCSICHGGPAFTDNRFHNVGLAQIGPGEGDGPNGNDDFGRFRVTGGSSDKYAFRSTPLRNVELTGPYGHGGQFMDLSVFIDHYSESDVKLPAYDVTQLDASLQGMLLHNTNDILATCDPLLAGVVFGSDIVDRLRSYMQALTDDAARDLTSLTPASVPSRLPVDGRSMLSAPASAPPAR